MPLIMNSGNIVDGPIVHHGVRKGIFHAIRDGKWKFIHSPNPELYDLNKDLEETQNVYESNKNLAKSLKIKMDEIINTVAQREQLTDYGRLKLC